MKPGDFYVGVIDFFSILLPGALLGATAAIVLDMPPVLRPLLTSDTARWVAFALSAYALGHFAFLISSRLDDIYDRYRPLMWPRANDEKGPFMEARALRCAHFANGADPEKDVPMNTFKWAKAVLTARAPAALADVNRYEAHSKFFRSMAVALPIAGAAVAFAGDVRALPTALLLAAVAFFVYAQQRFRSTEWAYRYVLVLQALGELDGRRPGPKGSERADADEE